ncbi:MAG: 30S ribosomal protein S16 [Saprospiraceae bacterium]|nr:30S ribosomal protein S16 [Saprospiraceae bacterium]
MAVKIRLQRKGRTKAPYYHIVIADARSPRDGKFIERLGFYNPTTVPASIDLDRDKAYDWLMKGAQPMQAFDPRCIQRCYDPGSS